MEYYKIKRKTRFPELGRIASGAEGKNVPEKEYFYRIGKGEIIENTPIFDYFVLKSFDKEKYWEWALFDVHDFIGVGSIMCGWYISDKLKTILEKFRIAPKYHFYETRLLYKEEKFKYWIFQFPIEPLQNIIFEKSDFYYIKDGKQNEIEIKNESEFMQIRRDLFIGEDIELECSKVCLLDSFDIVYQQPNGDILCSEHLKQAIEENGITGFEFFDIDYEVVVE
jgi:hypothetical protein|nr:MAG TPA: hypothetical protein [Caudoviricetes sp.]